ncbi:MAG: uracil-DNA glycosylase [Methanobacteriota archaeon]
MTSHRGATDGRGWTALAEEIVVCRRCPRLVAYRERVARTKRAAFRSWTYWGRPLPGFGDPHARLAIVGLAPAAHGGNRTGRIFTGDRSGDWLFRALHRAGFANRSTSVARDDGLVLRDAYVTAAVRCAPPENRPTPREFTACRVYLERELVLLGSMRAVVVLGHAAMDAFLRAWSALGHVVPRPRPAFRHGAAIPLPPVVLVASYHPSQRNTSTGRLTEPAFDAIFRAARSILDETSR